MKKKILSIALVVAMIAIIAAGSFAYFTDKDAATNTFTTGKVDITLNEKFDPDNAKLLPGSQKTNAVQKEVSIKLNDGSEDAYVWYEWYIPSVLDSIDGSTGTNNVVHVNSLGSTWDNWRNDNRFWAKDQTEALPLEKTWDHDPEVELGLSVGPQGFIRTEEVGGVMYNVYLVLYHGKLSAGDETTVGMNQVYMDQKVDTNAQGQYTINGDVIDYDFSKDINIIVKAYAIQADGFADVYAAYKAYTAQK